MEKGQHKIDAPREIEYLREEAREAIISANVNPSDLTPEEHLRVTLLQEVASRAVMAANSTITFVKI